MVDSVVLRESFAHITILYWRLQPQKQGKPSCKFGFFWPTATFSRFLAYFLIGPQTVRC
jgi:hypothetical protein